jgi:hypothetical protein
MEPPSEQPAEGEAQSVEAPVHLRHPGDGQGLYR